MKTVKNRYLPQQYTEILMINSSLNNYSRAIPLYGRGVQRRLSLWRRLFGTFSRCREKVHTKMGIVNHPAWKFG